MLGQVNIETAALFSGIMLLSGFLQAFGMISLQKAMKYGHHGISWAVGQSAMIIPYLSGVFFWHDNLTAMQAGGIISIVSSIFLFGQVNNSSKEKDGSKENKWFIWSLIAMLLLGMHQMLASSPSRYETMKNLSGFRYPLLAIGTFMAGMFMIFRSESRFSGIALLIRPAIIIVLISLPAGFLLFASLDAYSALSLANLVYPLAVGVSIFTFALYSVFRLREKIGISQVAAFVIGSIGFWAVFH
jgi:hypothetical protein